MNATVVGIMASGSVQAVAQALCDAGVEVQVIRECIHDDDKERCNAIINHILPIYATVISLADMIDQTVGFDLCSGGNDDASIITAKPVEQSSSESTAMLECCGMWEI